MAASASAAEVESHLSHKLLLVTGLLVGSAAWFAASLTGSGRQAEPPLRLPLAVPVAKMPAASQPAWQKDPSLPVPLLDLGRQDPAAEHAEPAAVAAARPVAAEAWVPRAEPSTASPEEDTWTTVHVESGDNLWTLFTRLGISSRDLHDILKLSGARSHLASIHPSEQLKLRVDRQGTLQELIYPYDVGRTLHVSRIGGEFRAIEIDQPLETRVRRAAGTIHRSLFESGQAIGIPDHVIMDLTKIFGWDIDFALDIQAGDRFSVLYEEHYLEGAKVDDGDILAAQFRNGGTLYRAVRYTDAEGSSDYYTPDGRRLHRSFLRTPVEFSRVSSGFSLSRYHPILHRFRAHRGVDYAAPLATPVMATGAGRVAFSGTQGGYGNVVIIQHGDRSSTLYGHLLRVARGVTPGAPVRQGQVIGYVGQSGLATGPHLHYEFRVDGTYQDPRTVTLPQSEPVPPAQQENFLRTSRQLLAELKGPLTAHLALETSAPGP